MIPIHLATLLATPLLQVSPESRQTVEKDRVIHESQEDLTFLKGGVAVRSGDDAKGAVERFEKDGSYIVHQGEWGGRRGSYTISGKVMCYIVEFDRKCMTIVKTSNNEFYWKTDLGIRIRIISIVLI